MGNDAVALIPLRGGSKSIPGKNVKLIAGKPLCAWVLEAAHNARCFSSIYVSTDCDRIKQVVRSLGLGVEIVDRLPELATDTASTESVILHFMQLVEFKTLATIQATSPLVSSKDLKSALDQFENQQLDSMASAVRTKRFFWRDDCTPINYDPLNRPRRQDFAGTLMENGAFYFTRHSILEQYRCRLGGKIGIYEMDESTAIEIDESEDWERVERLLLERNAC